MNKPRLQDNKIDYIATVGGINGAANAMTLQLASFGDTSPRKLIALLKYTDPGTLVTTLEVVRFLAVGVAVSQMERNYPSGGAGQSFPAGAIVEAVLESAHVNDLLDALETGWMQADTALTMAYVSASSFTIVGDFTGVLGKGDKIKLTNASTKYFYVSSTSYGGGLTTVNVLGGTDYVLASGAVSGLYYSHADNPVNFPTSFTYSPGIGGLASGGTSAKTAQFSIRGGRCYVDGQFSCGTATYSGAVFSLAAPIAAKAGTGLAHQGSVWATDAGTSQIFGVCYLLPATTDINLLLGGSGFPTQQAAGNYPITWANGDVWKVSINYPI